MRGRIVINRRTQRTLTMADADHSLAFKNSQSVLVLSTGYEPMFKTDWKRAISAVICGRAEVVETHDELCIRTVKGSIPFPTKVRFINGTFVGKIKGLKRVPKPTKRNIWSRDLGECQYCGMKVSLDKATIDHVIPKSRGGRNTWENVTLACAPCNQKKGSSLLEHLDISLRNTPSKPTMDQVIFVK